MRRWHLTVFLLAALALGACASPQNTPQTTPGADGTAQASVPTSSAPDPNSQALPRGTLILTQLNIPVAQTPDLRTIRLNEDRFGGQASPDGRYGVRFNRVGSSYDLALADYGVEPPSLKEVPEGKGMSGPGVTWKADSTGFAFFDFPVAGQSSAAGRTIFYYDIASGQTRRLIPDVAVGKVATSVAFSPDGRTLLYVVGDANAEGVGGPGSQPYVLDVTNNQATPLSADSLLGFSQWLADSSGFLVLRADPVSGLNGLYLYTLANIDTPSRLTPTNTSDLMVDLSPDGKRVVVTSADASQAINIYMMNLDGSNRKALTKFTDVEQTITALIWAPDGIYYSLSGATNQDTTWRMDLDGSNAAQVAQGTLNAIVGAR